MNLFLCSQAIISIYENDKKIDSKLDKNNNLVENLMFFCKNAKNFVYIANNPNDFEDNDVSGKFVFEAFLEQGFPLEKLSVLDNRNTQEAKSIVENSDIVFLRGGTLKQQIDFIKSNSIDKFLQNTKATIIGQSAGAMILSKNIYQYPETDEESCLPRFISGIGFFDLMIIPHFNKATGNELYFGNHDLIKDFFLPDSIDREFWALENGSYILIADNKKQICGNAYKIANKNIEQICFFNQTKNI